MKTFFLAATSKAIVDQQTNALSLIEVLDVFEVLKFPVLLPHLTIVWLVTRESTVEPEISEFTIQLLNNSEKSEFPVRVDFKGKLRHRAIMQFQGIPLNSVGSIDIKISEVGQKKIIASLSIPIVLQQSNIKNSSPHK